MAGMAGMREVFREPTPENQPSWPGEGLKRKKNAD